SKMAGSNSQRVRAEVSNILKLDMKNPRGLCFIMIKLKIRGQAVPMLDGVAST
ncbi:hypothetical protein L9F63_001741, partial [Diploptera punctata]